MMGRNGFGVGVVSVLGDVPAAGVVGTDGWTSVVVMNALMFGTGRPRMTHQRSTVCRYPRKRII